MALYVVNDKGRDTSVVICAASVARLQESVGGGYMTVVGQGMSIEHDFQFIACLQRRSGIGNESIFWRKSYPIDILRQVVRTVGFYSYVFTTFMKQFDKAVCQEKRGLTAGDYYESSWELGNGSGNVGF